MEYEDKRRRRQDNTHGQERELQYNWEIMDNDNLVSWDRGQNKKSGTK